MFYNLPGRIWQWSSLSVCVSRSCDVFYLSLFYANGNDTCCCFTTFSDRYSRDHLTWSRNSCRDRSFALKCQTFSVARRNSASHNSIIVLACFSLARLFVFVVCKIALSHRDCAWSAILTHHNNKHKSSKDRGDARGMGGCLLLFR